VPTTSAGILLYRSGARGLEVLLVHPGGPFFVGRDAGVWSIPKGEPAEGEDLLVAARRELGEETGFAAPGAAIPLGSVRQAGGKVVHAFAVRGDADPRRLRSNVFELEWPRASGRTRAFPEVDAAAWLDLVEARRRIVPAQAAFLEALVAALAAPARWLVWRRDDHGNRFEVSRGHDEAEARRIAAELEGRGHKQSYGVEPE
jgi:predicted NUDIX family NTP pyrophosphohydrolase